MHAVFLRDYTVGRETSSTFYQYWQLINVLPGVLKKPHDWVWNRRGCTQISSS